MAPLTASGDLLTVGQVAELLGKPPRTIHHWISIGKLPAEKLDPTKATSAYVIRRSDAEQAAA